MQYYAVPCSTMQYHAVLQYHAIPCSTMQYHAVPCNTMQYCSTMQYHAVQCSTVQYNAVPCSAIKSELLIFSSEWIHLGSNFRFCYKLKPSNPYIFATWWCKPLIFQTYLFYIGWFIIWNIGLQRYMDYKSEFVAKTQIRYYNYCNPMSRRSLIFQTMFEISKVWTMRLKILVCCKNWIFWPYRHNLMIVELWKIL